MGRIVIDLSFEYHNFVKPNINRQQFEALKKVLTEDPAAIIEPKSKTFIEQFTLLFKILGGSILLGLISLIIIYGFDADSIVGIFILLVVTSILAILKFLYLLIMEGATYANFLKRKESYYQSLRVAVMQSTSYEDFQSLHEMISD